MKVSSPVNTTFEEMEIFPVGEIPIFDSFMKEQGISRERWLLGTRWTEEDIDKLDKPFLASSNELDILYRNVLRLSKYPDSGLRLGERLNLSRWGILAMPMLFAENLGEALLTQKEFLPLLRSSIETDYEYTGNDLIVSVSLSRKWTARMNEQQHLELFVSSFRAHISDLLCKLFFFKRAEFPFSAPEYEASFYPKCSYHVEFDRPQMRLWIPKDVLFSPLKMSNRIAFKQAMEKCNSELKRIRDHESNDTCLMVKELLEKSNMGFPKLDEMAMNLDMSGRTLKRHLHRSGTTYRSLVGEAQLDKAKLLLVDSNMAIGDIATQCGFRSGTGLRDAFKRQYEISPKDYRKNLGAIC